MPSSKVDAKLSNKQALELATWRQQQKSKQRQIPHCFVKLWILHTRRPTHNPEVAQLLMSHLQIINDSKPRISTAEPIKSHNYQSSSSIFHGMSHGHRQGRHKAEK